MRETKGKSIRKKERGSTRDVANRKLRTRDKSSANRANSNHPQVLPYSNRSRKQEKSAKPRGRVFSQSPRESHNQAWKGDVSGYPIKRVKPGKGDAARTNIYPQKGPFVSSAKKHPDKKPPVYSRTNRGTRFVRQTPRHSERAWKGGADHGPIRYKSASGSIKNTYSQKGPYVAYYKKHLSIKEKPVSNRREVAQTLKYSRKPLTGGGRVGGTPPTRSRPFIKSGKKNVYWGKFQRKEKAVTNDLTGRPVRTRNFRSTPGGLFKRDTLKFFGKKPFGDRANQRPGGGYISTGKSGKGWLGDIAGWRLRKSKGHREVAGKFVFPRKMSISGKQKRTGAYLPGGGYESRTKSGDQAQLKSAPARIYPHDLNGKVKKGVRKQIGGDGSYRAGKFSGNIRKGQGYSQQIAGYSGNIKRSSIRGISTDGVNYSGRIKRSSIRGISTDGVNYSGNIKRSSIRGISREGVDYSGNIRVTRRRGFNNDWYGYSGTINRNRARGISSQGLGYSGNIKRSSINGFSNEGLSYSGRTKRTQTGFSREGASYRGNILPEQLHGFTKQGADYSGNIKRHRAEKGGGSVTGTINDNKPLQKKEFFTQGANYSGRIALSRFKRNYVQNPNASKESLKKKKPDETTYRVAGLQVKVKQAEYAKKPNAAKYALPGKAPSSSTVKASQYSRSMKQTWDYKHNPNSAREALDVRVPGNMNARIDRFKGNTKIHRYSGSQLHPDAKFAHGFRDNVDSERTFLMNVKLKWAKLFRKSETQPKNLKERNPRPKYDKREKGMWND